MSTRRTQLRRRKEPVQWQIASAIPFRLVFQFTEYFGKRRISNVLGQIRMFQHPDYVQSFDKDRLVFADDLRRELLKRIPSGVTDFGVQSRHSESGLCPIITILDLTRQPTLKYSQSLFILNERARTFDLLALAGRSKRLNTNVYADFGSGLPERFDLGFNKDADKIASTCVPADSQIEDFSVIGKLPTPNNIELFGLLGQYDSTISKGEGIGGVANRLAMTARFKFRILRSLLEEVRESRIQITQRLLKNNRTDLGKEGFLRFLFPFSEFQCGAAIAEGFLLLLPSLAAIIQSPIVNIARAAEGSGKLLSLLTSREEPVFESLLNYHGDILRQLR